MNMVTTSGPVRKNVYGETAGALSCSISASPFKLDSGQANSSGNDVRAQRVWFAPKWRSNFIRPPPNSPPIRVNRTKSSGLLGLECPPFDV